MPKKMRFVTYMNETSHQAKTISINMKGKETDVMRLEMQLLELQMRTPNNKTLVDGRKKYVQGSKTSETAGTNVFLTFKYTGKENVTQDG